MEHGEEIFDDEGQQTQCTQNVMDPRRAGRNHSGLSAEDVSDVMCILHPCTPAAFKLVTDTLRRASQHVLQGGHLHARNPHASPSLLEEQETFILAENAPNQGLDLAVRFSAKTVRPHFGFVFGRNRDLCDVVVSTDAHKRVSNVHFRIFMNNSGVLMLEDMSTNGTMVDDTLLKRKGHESRQSRMLDNGSIIQILSPNHDEVLRFIVRIPTRDGHLAEYQDKFVSYARRMAEANVKLARGAKAGGEDGAMSTTLTAPIIRNQYGMHWNGGEHYNVVGHIGKGAFASVYQLATKRDGQLFAAKELEKRKFMKNGILDRKLENEMQIMQQISHPNIVQYVDYQDQANHLYIIMEFIGCGDLQQYLNANREPLPEAMAKRMALQVFDALEYLHKKRITHRDIKPDNLLIADLGPETFKVKLSDFGLSKVVKDNDTFLKTFCGTLLYCAPEVFPHYDAHVSGRGVKRPRHTIHQPPAKAHIYSSAVDIWSFGAVLWYSLCMKPPFEGVSDATGRGMFEQIMMTPLDVSDLQNKDISSEAISLLVKMLNTDPTARPPPFHCLYDAWFGRQLPETLRVEYPILGAIAEETDGGNDDDDDEPDVASLSLGEPPLNSQRSEVSLDSADLNFFDPRVSKRFKPNDVEYREQEDINESSSDLDCQSIRIAFEDNAVAGAPPPARTPPKATKPKLFGEISRSDLRTPDLPTQAKLVFGNAEGSVTQSSDQHMLPGAPRDEASPSQVKAASSSLLGAESLVRDLHMQVDSPQSNASNEGGEDSEPKTPETPQSVNQVHSAGAMHPTEDTPKAQPTPFNRKIEISYPASFYWKADDPSTHNLKYSSELSGHDYAAKPTYTPRDAGSSMAPTQHESSSNSRSSDPNGATSVTSFPTDPQSTPPKAKYGRLVSTPDSFAHVVINLDTREAKWGRDTANTHVYPDPTETRISKEAIVLSFHANGIEAVEARGEDWTNMRGLHCELLTHSSIGLRVNGVPLPRLSVPGRQPYGRVHTGDEITVWPRTRDGAPVLSFILELHLGEGQLPRAADVPFKVESGDTSQRHWAPARRAAKTAPVPENVE